MAGESDPARISAAELIAARTDSRWTGGSKFLTTDCPNCRLYLDGTKTCEWGVTYKYLVLRERGARACALLSTSSPREQKILQNRELVRVQNEQ